MLTSNIVILNVYLFLNAVTAKATGSDETSSLHRYLDVKKPSKESDASADSLSEENVTGDKYTGQEAVNVKKKELQSSRNKNKLKYYFSVSIQKRGSHYASGAIVDAKWILTVAELFYNIRESINLYSARLGSFNCKKGGIVVPLKGIEIHPEYTHHLPNFDLALLRIPTIDTDISNYVHPIKLARFGEDQIQLNKYWSTYWPRLIVKGYILPQSATERYKQNTMHVSPQELIPRSHCKGLLKSSEIILHNSSICLEPINSYHSRCMPDAGAPIVTKKYLWAITSGWTSSDCIKNTSPVIAIKLSSKFVRPWLKLMLNIASFEEV